MKLVLVEWVDPCSSGPFWEDRDNINGLTGTPCITVGIVLKETQEDIRIVLSNNICKYSQAITIPRCCIKRVRKLKALDKLQGNEYNKGYEKGDEKNGRQGNN